MTIIDGRIAAQRLTGSAEPQTIGGGVFRQVSESVIMPVHNLLTGRGEENCHPIAAITGLVDELTEEITNDEILSIWNAVMTGGN